MKSPLYIFYFLILFSLLLVPLTGMAQPVLTYAAFAPNNGDQYTVGHSGTYYAGTNGINQTWNFSAATVSTNETYTVMPTSNVPCGSQFPSAVQSIGSGGNYSMLNVSTSDYLFYGSTITPAQPSFIYSDPEKFFQFPMNYLDNFTDYSQAVDNSGPVYRRGMDTITYCGYGTITTPYSTYSNAICIHRRYAYADSTQFSYNACGLNFYYWFVAGYRYPVAQSWKTDLTCGFSAGTLFLQSISIGMPERNTSANDISVSPNPFSTQLHLSGVNNSGSILITVRDISGRAIYSIQLEDGSSEIDLSALAEGIYFITIGDQQPQKVIKAK